MSFQIILGSASKARRRILTEMGYEFSLMTADIDEKSIRKEKPEELVMTLAEAKADAIISRLKNTGQLKEFTKEVLLITADTIVVSKGVVREKPSSKEEARDFIKGFVLTLVFSKSDSDIGGGVIRCVRVAGYSGAQADVVGSVLVTNLKTGKSRGDWERAEVYFHDIPDEVIDSLVEEAITMNVAGGLMLEHPLTLRFVEAVVGTSDAVMGLPKALTEKLIQEALQF